jgi:hypothetical protein
MESNGIRFDLCTKEEAAKYLRVKTFLFKIKAFDKNFDRWRLPNGELGKYLDLDFAYLVELSRLDRDLRFFVIHAALDVEHYLKVHLNKSLMNDRSIDPYGVISDFFDFDAARKRLLICKELESTEVSVRLHAIKDRIAELTQSLDNQSCPTEALAKEMDDLLLTMRQLVGNIDLYHCENSISQLETSSYSHGIAKKYGTRGKMAYWNFLELATFGDIIAFYKYYFIELKGSTDATAKRIKPLLFPAKALRNAAAHNSNLLSGFRQKSKKPVGRIATFLKNEYKINEVLIDKTRRIPVIHDFGALMLTYDAIVPEGSSKLACAANLKRLSSNMAANIKLFTKQPEVYDGLLCLSEISKTMSVKYK